MSDINTNQAPTPQQDSASVVEFGTIDNIDVLSNDSDPEGDSLTVISAIASNGSAYVNADNTTISYTASSAGVDYISYTVQDLFGNTAESVVVVDVLGDTGGGGFNNAPVTSDDYATTDEFTSVTVDVVANDYDIDGDPLTLEGVYLQQGEGEISVVGNNITVTPFVGAGAQEIVVGYNVTDGISSSSATLNVTVSPSGGGNIPPEAIDDYAITGVNQPVTIDVLANDYDLDGDTLSLYQVYVSPEVGQVVVNENSTITFIPNEGFIGQAQIEYSIQDSSGMSPSVAFLYVNVQIQSGQFLQGTDGDDSLVGTLGADTIVGMGGNDWLLGDSDDGTGQYLAGSDDVLVGGTGNDRLTGVSGNDVYVFYQGDGQDQINNYDPNQTINEIQSVDRLVFGSGINPSDIQIAFGTMPYGSNVAPSIILSVNGTNDQVTIFGGDPQGQVFSLQDVMVDAIEFADGTVWTKEQILSGLNPVENQIIGDDGNNLLVDTDANDHIQGLAGNDTLVGSHGNDLLEGGDGDDVLVEQSSQIFLQDLSQLYNSSLVNNLGGTQGFGENSIALGDDNLEQIDISAIFGQSGGFTAQISTNGTIFLNGIQGSTNITIYGRDLDTRTREGLLPTAGGNSTGSNTVYYDIDTANGILTVTWDDVAIYGTSILNAFQLQIIRQGDAGDYDVVLRYEDVQEGYINIGFNGQPIQSPVDLQTTGQGVYGFKVRNGLIHSSLGGNNTLVGGQGYDVLVGGDGNDTYVFNLGDGQDVINNSPVDIFNQNGFDRLVFGVGINPSDIELRGNGVDLILAIKGTLDSVTLVGALANVASGLDAIEFADGTVWDRWQIEQMPLMVVGNGNNILNGMSGNDTLTGSATNDLLIANAGNDILIGGLGSDTLNGGSGSDTYIFNLGDGSDVLADYDGNQQDYNRLVFGGGINPTDIEFSSLPSDSRHLVVSVKGTNDSITIQNYFDNQEVYGLDAIEFADGTIWTAQQIASMALVVIGNNNNNYLYGTDGNDLMQGLGGDDYLFGNNGNDTMDGGIGHDVLYGGFGNDSLYGGDASQEMSIIGYQEVITGYQDVLVGYQDVIIGYQDVLVGYQDVIVGYQEVYLHDELVITGYEEVIIDYDIHGQPIYETRPIEVWQPVYVTEPIYQQEPIYQSEPIYSQEPVYENQPIYGQEPIYDLVTVGGNDELYGDFGNDILNGGAGQDFISGGDSDDTLIGGLGNDHLQGDNGNDTYVFNLGDGQDSIYNFDSAEVNNAITSYDRLVFGMGINPADIQFSINPNNGNHLLISIAGTTDSILIQNYFANPSIFALDSIEFADGTVWSSSQIASMVSPLLHLVGDNNDNSLEGTNTHDLIEGLGGDDYLYANDGDDTLIGGTGNDYLTGNLGSDTYIFNLGDGQDMIYQWNGGDQSYDRLVFGAGINANDIEMRRNINDGNDLVIAIKGTADFISLRSYYNDPLYYGLDAIEFADGTVWTATQVADLAANISLVGTDDTNGIYGSSTHDVLMGLGANDYLNGYEGDDTLIGGTGNDYLTGNLGNDTYVFNLGDGQDTVFNYDANSQDNDRLVFGAGINQNDINLHVSGSDLIVAIKGTTDSVNIVGYFSNQADYALNAIEFADGTVWTAADIYDRLITNNAAPVAVDDIADASVMITHYEDGTPDNIISNGIYINVLENDSDANGDFLTVGILSVTGGTAVVNYDRTISYFADGTQTQGQIRYQIADGLGGTSEATVNVNVDIIEKLEYTVIVPTEQPFEFNPIENDYGYAQGDPHMYTFDGVAYEFQAVGEFTFVQGDGYEVQIRTEAINNRVSGVTATAMKFGDDVVGIYSKAANRLVINGAAVELASGVSIKVGTGYVSRQGDTYEINDGAGHLVLVDSTAGYDFVRMPVPKNQSVTGLLGNANDSHDDEFILRDGTQLDSNIPESTIYTTFANSWRVDNSTSLFVYGAGESTATYTNLNFPVDGVGNGDWRQDFEPNIVAWAEQIALDYGLARGTVVFENAVLDIVVSGNTEIIQQTLQIAQELTEAGVELIVNQQMPPMQTGTLATLANGLEDTTYTLFASDLLQGYTDVNGDVLSVINLQATDGSLVDNQDGTFSFTPNANFNGTVNINYQVSDGHNGIVDVVNSFILDEVNDAPIAGAFTPLEMGTEDIVYAFTANDLLQGFSDAEGDSLSVVNLTATNGALSDNQNGTYSFTPDANFNGTVNISYQVSDGHGGIAEAANSFVLSEVNDLPVLTDVQATLANGTEDSVYTLYASDLLQGFSDVDGDALSVISLQATNGVLTDNQDGTYSFTPDANFNGTVNISYQVSDGRGGIAEAAKSFVLSAVIDLPVLTGVQAILGRGSEDTAYVLSTNDLLQGFSDADGDALSVINLQATNGVLIDNQNGTYTFTPNANFNGIVNVTYQVSDGQGGIANASNSFVIDAVNDAPTINPNIVFEPKQIDENQLFSFTFAEDVFVDVDGDQLSYMAMQANGDALPSWLSFDSATRTFMGTPSFNDAANLILKVIASDGMLSTEQVFSLMVNNVNRLPTGSPTVVLANVEKGTQSYNVALSDLLQGFEDADGDLLTISNLTADHATVVNNNNGTYTLTLEANYHGVVALNYQVIDGQGGSINTTQGFTVVVNTTGTTGADVLEGGDSDDTYIVNNVRDVVVEADANGGIDTVQSSLSYNLGSNLENLVLVGTTNLSGTGNNLNNMLTGNDGNNRLLAGLGNDTLYGGAGGDTLNGGEGADQMFGGAGNDTFTVENANDLVVEFANKGYDTVNSFITYTLTANVERLNLENAGGQIDGFGNELDNTLNGNNFANYLFGGVGNDTLQGKGGADTLEGGLGDDVYYVDNIGDVVTELAGEGTDKVNSTISYTLTANVEQLYLTGIAGLSGTGNAQNNIIYGNSGNNLLSGGAGNDSLNGGAGNDTLDGGQGNDTLVGGLGNDSYLLGIGSGRDTIDNKDSVGNDVLLLGTGVTAEQVWLRQLGNDLEVSIIGTNNSAKIKGWYSGNADSQLDSLQLADGRTLLTNEVQSLVEAMAAFAPPTVGQTTLTNEQQAALTTIITTSW